MNQLPHSGTQRDHPRIRGEHQVEVLYIQLLQGSPPHTRGTQCLHLCSQLNIRITPAYAGNTCIVHAQPSSGRDHPRIRGEHLATVTSLDLIPGSPPHTRGTLLLQRWTRQSRRITPAYAGNTFATKVDPSKSKDHPRIRGEHCFQNLQMLML